MSRDRVYLIHISESIKQVRDFTAEGRDAFFADAKTQNAVMYCLQTLTESTQRLSETAKLSHPEIDWWRLSGFRNMAVHGYLNIDLAIIWRIVEQDLDALQTAIEAMSNAEGLT